MYCCVKRWNWPSIYLLLLKCQPVMCDISQCVWWLIVACRDIQYSLTSVADILWKAMWPVLLCIVLSPAEAWTMGVTGHRRKAPVKARAWPHSPFWGPGERPHCCSSFLRPTSAVRPIWPLIWEALVLCSLRGCCPRGGQWRRPQWPGDWCCWHHLASIGQWWVTPHLCCVWPLVWLKLWLSLPLQYVLQHCVVIGEMTLFLYQLLLM